MLWAGESCVIDTQCDWPAGHGLAGDGPSTECTSGAISELNALTRSADGLMKPQMDAAPSVSSRYIDESR